MAKHPYHLTIASMQNHPHHNILRAVLEEVFGDTLLSNPKRDRLAAPGQIRLTFKGLSRQKWVALNEAITRAFGAVCSFISTEGKRVVNLFFPMTEWQPHPAT